MIKPLLALSVVALISASLPTDAYAQQYPSRPIRMINPNAPGGVTDRMSRQLAKEMEAFLGQPVIVENRGGAAGVVAIEHVLKSQPDGYVVGNTCPGPVLVLPLTGASVPYNFDKDAIVVGMMGGLDVLITARGNDPIRTYEQLIAEAKANPGKVSIGMVQTPSNVVPIAYMAKQAGVELNIIGYRGEALALTDLLSGVIRFAINAPGTVLPHIKAGTVQPIIVLNKERNSALPNTPSLSDTKLPGFAPGNYCVIFMPKGTPPDVVNRFNAALNQAGKVETLRKAWLDEGLVPFIGGTPAAAGAFFGDISNRWRDVVKEVDYSKLR